MTQIFEAAPLTREQWLNEAVTQIALEVFAPHDIDVPKIRVSVGWPSRGGTGTTKRVIGQCWKGMVAKDGVHQIFISPVLDDLMQILETLVHEMVHAIDDCESGHKGAFAKMARKVGLEGKMTATHAGGSLALNLAIIAEQLGDFDHSGLVPNPAEKKQSTRMLKLEAACCGYIVRTTQKWIDQGLPSCPCGTVMEEA